MHRFLLIAAVGLIAGPANAGVVPVNPYNLNTLIQSGQTQLASNGNRPQVSWTSFGWRALSAPSRGYVARQSASHRKFTRSASSLKSVTVKKPIITSPMKKITDIRPIAPVALEIPHPGGSRGIVAQSIGGSGGNGGNGTMILALAGNGGKGGATAPSIGGSGVMAQSIGSSGGNGIRMQALAGSGGNGGVAIQSIGGSGGTGGVSIAAQPLDSGDFGIFAQSIGGGGVTTVSVLSSDNGKSGSGTSAAVSAVPLPAGVLMFGSLVGFGAAAAVYRRRRAAKQAGGASAG